MAVLPIAKVGNPILRKIANPVDPATIGSRRFQEFLDDMFETMVHFEGIGLHTGLNCQVTLEPAPVNHGIVFERTESLIEGPNMTLFSKSVKVSKSSGYSKNKGL